MLGLCGAHRVGKSSLARAYAEKVGAPLVLTSASSVFKDMGLDPAITYDFDTRLTVQEEILTRFDKLYAEHSTSELAITDRTPLDMLAYTMADVSGQTLKPEHEERFQRYVQRCIDVTNRRFSLLMVVQPGIEVVPAEGKASLSNGYIEHLNSIILGLSVDERIKPMHFYLPRYMTEMDDRVMAVEYAVGRGQKRAETERDSGVALH